MPGAQALLTPMDGPLTLGKMPTPTSKTVRFSELVQRSGAPEVYAIWTDPKTDASLKKAVAQKRILTVHQENVGSRKDFGVIGFEEGKHLTYLLFPKALKAPDGTKVVGLKYDQLAEPKVPDPVTGHRSTSASKSREPTAPKRERSSAPALRKFSAVIQFKMQVQSIIEIEATSHREARKKALAAAEFDPNSASTGKITKQIAKLVEKH